MEALVRIRNSASLLGPAGLGTARLLRERVMAAPRRVLVGAGLAALVAGIGGNALLLQIGRHPAPLFAAPTHDPLPASARTASAVATVEPVAPHASPTPVSSSNAASAAPPPAAGQSRATGAAAPDTTSSIGPAAQDEQHPSPAPSAPAGPDRGERPVAARAPDQIAALLRGKPVDDGSHLVRAAQIALAKLGYAVKPDGAENAATRRALRRFERAHGLTPTTEISPELVKQLTAAARAGG
jgi:Putative peptidoglycan binding domain